MYFLSYSAKSKIKAVPVMVSRTVSNNTGMSHQMSRRFMRLRRQKVNYHMFSMRYNYVGPITTAL